MHVRKLYFLLLHRHPQTGEHFCFDMARVKQVARRTPGPQLVLTQRGILRQRNPPAPYWRTNNPQIPLSTAGEYSFDSVSSEQSDTSEDIGYSSLEATQEDTPSLDLSYSIDLLDLESDSESSTNLDRIREENDLAELLDVTREIVEDFRREQEQLPVNRRLFFDLTNDFPVSGITIDLTLDDESQ